MIAIAPFAPEHLARLHARPEQVGDAARFRRQSGSAAALGPAFTIFDHGGTVLACGGLAENAPGYATAWALFALSLTRRDWGGILRAIRSVLAESGYSRIDMLVRCDFPAARRFAAHLGFAPEAMLYTLRDEPLLDCFTRNAGLRRCGPKSREEVA